ncbi:MAG: hypothetical protein NC089_06240 [Bacteroides sp.]|nr:hypothetical protein [Bacteroides sp.]MCM1549986.1 hypothetical protein [Clostridium sp.]
MSEILQKQTNPEKEANSKESNPKPKPASEADTVSQKHPSHTPVVMENNLELLDMTPKERRAYQRQQEREKLRELTFWRKVQYIILYYFWKFAAVVAICFALFLIIRQVYIITRPIALDIALVNDMENTTFAETVSALYSSYYDVPEDARYLIDIGYEMYPEDTAPNDMTPYSKMLSNLTNESTQIIICDAAVVQFYAIDGYLTELHFALPPDLFEAVQDRLYECEGPVVDSDYYAIDLSGTRFAEETGIQLEQPLLCIPTVLGEENRETSFRFIRMILEMEEY